MAVTKLLELVIEIFRKYFDKAAVINELIFNRVSGNEEDPDSKLFKYIGDNKKSFCEVAG